MTENTQYAEAKAAKRAEAQAIVDAYLATIAVIDGHDKDLWYGGIAPMLATQRGNLMSSAFQIAQLFELPWDGPTFPSMIPPVQG